MDRQISRVENEYGVTCTFRGQRRLSPDEVARYLFRRVVSWGRSSNVFLRNGARLSSDVGSRPEYATPECDNVLNLVAHDKAGERILEGLLVDADRRLREEGVHSNIYLFKNNTDSAATPRLPRELLVSRHSRFARLAEHADPVSSASGRRCSARARCCRRRGARCPASASAPSTSGELVLGSTRSRPIINTRDEPHADAERFRQLP